MNEYFCGGADPARSMALLWRTREKRSRKGKPELSVDRIVRSAIELADAKGIEAVSMRKVAERLGVGTMSLYTYVPAKAELIDVMLDTVYRETARPDDVPGGWRGKLELIARENWALSLRHPWMLHVLTNRAVVGPNAIAKYDYELRALAGLGLTEIEMDSVLSLVLGHVRTAARGAIEARQIEHQTGFSDEQWWAIYAPLLSRVVDLGRYPTAARVGTAAGAAHGSAYNAQHAFVFGLDRILEGVAALIRERTARPDQQRRQT